MAITDRAFVGLLVIGSLFASSCFGRHEDRAEQRASPPPVAIAPVAPAAPSATWPPPARLPSLSGVYASQWSAGASTVTLTHTGDFVIGTFTNPPGIAPGVLSGILDEQNVLRGRWTDARTSGGFILVFAPDGQSFRGTWGRTLDSIDDGGAWSGTRR